MNIVRFMLYALLVIASNIVCPHHAYAQSLKQTVSSLKMLPLHYGANNMHMSGRDILIVRGRFENGNAWDGDAYTVLIRQKDNIWQLARHEDSGWEGVLTSSQPHTEEDAITSIVFLVAKKTAKGAAKLYLLKTHRNYHDSPLDIVPAEFTLYVLQQDDDFGIYYLHKLRSEKSAGSYCNSDSAAYHELGIPLPGDGKEYDCLTK